MVLGKLPVPGRPTISDNSRARAYYACSRCGWVGWLVGCFGPNGPLRQYFSLYRAVSQREGERGEKGQMREKMSKQPPPAPTASATGPCPTIIQISTTPQHWKFTQHLRTTRPPPSRCGWGLFGHYFYLFFSLLFLPLFGRRPDID